LRKAIFRTIIFSVWANSGSFPTRIYLLWLLFKGFGYIKEGYIIHDAVQCIKAIFESECL
jgi:hypothetical protein